MISTPKKLLFLIMFGLICVFLLVMVEVGLRVAGYGYDTRAFFSPPDMEDIYVTNTNLFKKYYPRKPLTRPDTLRDMIVANVFSRNKSADTLRGFVVGGSTAQGFPYERNQSFGKITELALAAGGKYKNVEVLNLGLSAITSYCVKDMALKLLTYQPDFIVVYAGHNEYYGTISATTGGGYWSKNLYLALNEFRLFQFLFNLQNVFHPPKEYSTLMEEQFNRERLAPGPEMDEKVTAHFIQNMDAIVTTFEKENIPVIIIEPVSNLYDMPPFSGTNDAEYKAYIQKYAGVVEEGNIQKLQAFYQDRPGQKQYDSNANVRYLDARTRKILTGKASFNDFQTAKELDEIPFRAKEILVSRLRQYCQDPRDDRSNLWYIPLREIMQDMNGVETFGNPCFFDHLHFTQMGQRLVSRLLAMQVAGIFGFTGAEKQKVADFYRDDRQINKAIYYLGATRTKTFRRFTSLTENPPYNRMLIPYQRHDVDGLTKAKVNPVLIDLIEDAKSKNMDASIIIASTLIGRGKIAQGKKYLDLYLWTFPGCYRPHLIQARYRKKFTSDIEETFEAYKTAYLFSGKMTTIYDERKKFREKNKRPDLFAEIERYGRPNK